MQRIIIAAVLSCISIHASGFLPQDVRDRMLADGINGRYCSYQRVKEHLKSINSTEDRLIIAAYIQLELTNVPKQVKDKFYASSLWQAKTERVEKVIKLLTYDYEKKVSLSVYRECFYSVDSYNRVVPGLGNMHRALLVPERLERNIKLGI